MVGALRQVLIASTTAVLLMLPFGCTDYTPAAPTVLTVASIWPDGGSGSGGGMVTIVGTGFQVGATVTFGEIPAKGVRVGRSTLITAYPPAYTQGSFPAVVDVVVRNPDGRGYRLRGSYRYFEPGDGDACIGCWDY